MPVLTPTQIRKLIKADARYRIRHFTDYSTAYVLFDLVNPDTNDRFHVVDGRMMHEDWDLFAVKVERKGIHTWSDIKLSEHSNYVIERPKHRRAFIKSKPRVRL